MQRRTWTLIGAALVLMGIGVLALGLLEDEARVRQVGELVADPQGHSQGSFTLVGVPQPPRLERQDGSSSRENPEYQNTTRHVVMWEHEGRLVQSTLTLSMEGPTEDGSTHWTFRNTTRRAGDGAQALPVQEERFSLRGPHTVFLIESFARGDAMEHLWGIYPGVLKEPVQPKPSQFSGRMATTLPDGAQVPDGALLFWVEEYTAQCSSKFIPEEFQEEQQDGTPGTGEAWDGDDGAKDGADRETDRSRRA